MPDSSNLVKATLQELKPDFSDLKPGGSSVTVQFNPESLKVSYNNQIETPSGPGSQKGNAGSLHVGTRTTKMTLTLWFDVTRSDTSASDVRTLTQGVLYFIRPKPATGQADKTIVPPAVRFSWGSFIFDGVVESVEETLDYWSADGKPLRSSLNLSLSQQIIQTFDAGQGSAKTQAIAALALQGTPVQGQSAGTTPLTAASSGSTLQGLADVSGSLDWQAVASANGIENPRFLQPGQLVNLNPSISLSVN